MDSSSNNHGKAAPPKESSSDGRAPPKESSSEQSSSNTDSSPPQPHPPPMAPPNMMYYQPGPAGYPGHGPPPQPYHPYPPQPGYAPYPNEYPPHGYNNYPGGPYYGGGGGPQNYPTGGGGRGFFRGFIMCSCILFTAFFVATLVVALLLHPQLPVYKVSSLTLTNFDSNTTLTGDWDMNITVQNPNNKLKGYFSGFKVDVIHKNDVVAISYIPDFVLEKHEEKLMGVKASSSSIVSFQKWDLDEIATEHKSGSITFEIRMASMTAFRSPSMSTRSAMLIALCEGVKVAFQNNTGTLDNGGKPVDCQLFM